MFVQVVHGEGQVDGWLSVVALGKIAVPQPGGSGLYVSIPFPRWQRYEQFVSRVSGVSSNMAGLPLQSASLY